MTRKATIIRLKPSKRKKVKRKKRKQTVARQVRQLRVWRRWIEKETTQSWHRLSRQINALHDRIDILIYTDFKKLDERQRFILQEVSGIQLRETQEGKLALLKVQAAELMDQSKKVEGSIRALAMPAASRGRKT